MLFRPVAQELEIPCRGLRVAGVWATEAPTVVGDGCPWRRDGREEGVGFEGWGGGVGGNDGGV